MFQRACFSIDGKVARTLLIFSLFVSCGPSAIRRFVVTSRIWKTIDGVCWRWTRSHVMKEGQEGVPARADADPSATIVLPRLIWASRSRAASSHRYPNTMFARARESMGTCFGRDQFSVETPTTLRITGDQVATFSRPLGAAIAETFKTGMVTCWRDAGKRENHQTSKSATNQIADESLSFTLRHGANPIAFQGVCQENWSH